jgi:hypothetical protein
MTTVRLFCRCLLRLLSRERYDADDISTVFISDRTCRCFGLAWSEKIISLRGVEDRPYSLSRKDAHCGIHDYVKRNAIVRANAGGDIHVLRFLLIPHHDTDDHDPRMLVRKKFQSLPRTPWSLLYLILLFQRGFLVPYHDSNTQQQVCQWRKQRV